MVSNLIGCYQIKKNMADDMEGEYSSVVLKKDNIVEVGKERLRINLKKQQKKAVKQLYERKVSSFKCSNETINKPKLSVKHYSSGPIAEVEDMGLSTCNLVAKLEYMSDS